MSARSSRIALCCKGSHKLQAVEARMAVGHPAVGTEGTSGLLSFLWLSDTSWWREDCWVPATGLTAAAVGPSPGKRRKLEPFLVLSDARCRSFYMALCMKYPGSNTITWTCWDLSECNIVSLLGKQVDFFLPPFHWLDGRRGPHHTWAKVSLCSSLPPV